MGKKWDDATSSEKLFSLFSLLIFNNRPYSLNELMEILNASKSTVGRLIKKLEASGFGDIHSETRDRKLYYKMEKKKKLSSMNFDAENMRQFILLRDFMAHLLPEKIRSSIQNCLEQLPEKQHPQITNIGTSIGKGIINYAPYQNIIDILVKGIINNHVCKIEYKSSSGKESKIYSFAPKKILAYHECLYAEGWRVTEEDPIELKYEDPLRLAIQRFISCTLTNRSSASLPKTSMDDNSAFGIICGDQFEPFDVKIKFSPETALYVSERQWSDKQTVESLEDGSIILTAKMANTSECLAWVLSFGADATVLDPQWLIEELEKVLRKIEENYYPEKNSE